MNSFTSGRTSTPVGAVLALLAGSGLVGCGGSDAVTGDAVTDVARSALDFPTDDIDATLAPVRHLEAPGKVYLKSFTETFPSAGTFLHSVHVYQPDGNGESISFELGATDSGGVIDTAHAFRSVSLTTHPGETDESAQTLPDATGHQIYSIPTSVSGWYRLTFTYQAPHAARTLAFRAIDGAGHPLKTVWSDPPGTNAQVAATIVVEEASQTFLKGGAYRNATEGEYSTIDNVKVDGNVLYESGFDQGQFNYPLGLLSAAEHRVEFSFATSGTDPSYLWFGVNDQSFDPAGAKNAWAPVQFLYRGAMHTGDYDAWSEGVAFAQGASLAFGVRPPPVRRGTTFGLALEHPSLRSPWWNARLRIFPVGSNTETQWPAYRTRDYRGGIYLSTGLSTRYREQWLVSVPNDAPVGRYVVRALSPQGAPIGPDVLFYVIHNPYLIQQSGALSKAELETYAYDEDEDGMPLFGDYGPDADHARDHFTSEVENPIPEGYPVSTRLTAAFRRTQEPNAYSMLDYAMASADGTTSEFESMRRLFRLVSQRFYYTRPAIEDDASSVIDLASSPSDEFTPDLAAAASQPGFEMDTHIGGECFDYAFIMAAFARASGVPARVVSGGSIGGFGHHQFAEVFIPDLPHHGGEQSATGGDPSDQDPWYVFDATDPFSGMPEDGFRWTTHGESIAPRAMYGRATVEIRDLSNPPPVFEVYTTDVDWTPHYREYPNLPPSEILPLADVYSTGPQFWLTESGAAGVIGFSDKDIYRVSKEATGATAVRVRAVPSGGEALRPVLCVASATQPSPAMPEMCDSPAESVELPPGDSYVVVFNGEPNVAWSYRLRGESIQYELTLEDEDLGCDEATAVDMGDPGTTIDIPNDGCLKITRYPSWWGVRQMQLQNMTPGTYPVPFDWSNCGTTTGSATITQDWQSFFIDDISDDCTTFIKLNGAGDGHVTLRYYAM